MRNFVLTLSLIGLAACSSTPKTGQGETDAVLKHLSKGPVVSGKDWDAKFTKDGLIGPDLVAIGSIINAPHVNKAHLRSMTDHEAQSRLLISAPTEFKKVIQRAISSMDSGNGSFDEIRVSVAEVKALTGMNSNLEDFQCVTRAVPNTQLGYDIEEECRSIVRIPASKLLEAYNFTLQTKYNIKQDTEIKDAIKKQLIQDLTGQNREVASKN